MAKKPGALQISPSPPLLTLGGAVGVLLLVSLLQVAPVVAPPLIDYPRLIGGVLTSDPGAALWLGFAIVFVTGWLVWPSALAAAWSMLPGDALDLRGALLKGAVAGAALWALAGLLLPLLGALGRVPGVESPGLFGTGAGAGAALALLLGHLAYGVAVAVIAAMGRGIAPFGSLGVEGYRMTGGLANDPRTGVPTQ
jgi:hypothetical protein